MVVAGTMPIAKRRLLLVENHPLYRRRLRRLLEETGTYTVVAEAENSHQAIHRADIHAHDIVPIDVHLPGVTGLTLARVLRKQRPTAQLVVLSMYLDDTRRFDAIRAGAVAYLIKDLGADALVEAPRRVASGENLLNQLVVGRPQLAWRVLNEFRALSGAVPGHDGAGALGDPFLLLSSREIEVLDCVAQGLSNREIAGELFVTEQTVKNHMTSVLRKLDVNDRIQAVLYGVEHGWIELGPQPYAATVAATDRQSA